MQGLRIGTYSTLLTALVIAVVIVRNLIVAVLSRQGEATDVVTRPDARS